MWPEMALQLQMNMGLMSNYPALALEKFVRETSGACMITVDKGFWSPCMRETWMPQVKICGTTDACDLHSKGSGVCSVRLDGEQYSLTHCGVYPAPAVNLGQGREAKLFCPTEVPITVFPILKCAHTALSQWLAKLETAESQAAVSKLLREFHENGAASYLKAAQEKDHYREVATLWLQNEVNFGGPESFWNTLLEDVTLLGHNATLPAKVGWSMKLMSRLLFASGTYIMPESHLYLPPHLCSTCCSTGKGRLPVVVVRNPFSRLASNWRLTVVLPLQWALRQGPSNRTDAESNIMVAALQSLSNFQNFVALVHSLLVGKNVLDTVKEVASSDSLMGDRVPPWPASYPLSVGDVLHLIPVADLLSSGPEEWQQQKKMFLHMEHLEEDMKTLESVLCSGWGFCSSLPPFPHIKPTDEHPREQWGDAEESSWAYFQKTLRWSPQLVVQAADIYLGDFELLGYDPRQPDQPDPLHSPGVW